MSSQDHAPELDVTHARQARRGLHALAILVASTLLVLIALFGAWAFYSGWLGGPRGGQETLSASDGAVAQATPAGVAGAAPRS